MDRYNLSAMHVMRQAAFASVVACLLLAVGCGRSGLPGTIPIRGKVTYKGQPLTVGSVRYVPVDTKQGRVARGELKPDGSFQLTTLKPGDGALEGEYKIAVESFYPHPGEPGRTGTSSEDAPPVAGPAPRIPAKYVNAATSGLTDKVDSSHSGYKLIELSD